MCFGEGHRVQHGNLVQHKHTSSGLLHSVRNDGIKAARKLSLRGAPGATWQSSNKVLIDLDNILFR